MNYEDSQKLLEISFRYVEERKEAVNESLQEFLKKTVKEGKELLDAQVEESNEEKEMFDWLYDLFSTVEQAL